MGATEGDGTEPVTGHTETALKVSLYVVLLLAVVFAILIIEASIGHDGLHCELGLVLRDTDDACGGFWR